MERLARLVMHHRRIVSARLAGCCSSAACSPPASSATGGHSTSRCPASPGDQAEQQLIDTYGVSTFDTYVAVVTVPEGQTVDGRTRTRSRRSSPPRWPRCRTCSCAWWTSPAPATKGSSPTTAAPRYALIQAPVPTDLRARHRGASSTPLSTRRPRQTGFESGLTSYGLLSAGGDTAGARASCSRRCWAPPARCSCCSSCSRRSSRCSRC